MRAIAQACASEGWNARVVAVISNRADAGGLAFARARAIPTAVVDHKQFESRDEFDRVLAATVDSYAPDLLLLGGFMRVLTGGFVQRYEGRMLNIHPSLLPSFPGLHTHRRAIESGCKLTGCTVHFVTAELDHGPIVAQAVVPILPGDTEDTLSVRVLAREHQLYPRAVRWAVDDALRVEGDVVTQILGESQLLQYPQRLA
jgi:phosphoribosylglycinamide formyltransferase-1